MPRGEGDRSGGNVRFSAEEANDDEARRPLLVEANEAARRNFAVEDVARDLVEEARRRSPLSLALHHAPRRVAEQQSPAGARDADVGEPALFLELLLAALHQCARVRKAVLLEA